MTAADRRAVGRATAHRMSARTAGPLEPVVVNVRVHVLKSKNKARPYATTKQIRQTLAVLNDAYAGKQSPGAAVDTGFSFKLKSTDTRTNTDWDWARPDSKQEKAMKLALRKGPRSDLNLYLLNQTKASQLLGWSTLPQDQKHYPHLDGVAINVNALPGGSLRYYNLGDTATHEVGHWLGLFHTFEGGCSAFGDGVDDTPRERNPTDGCPRDKDTCPAEGADPVHNFMDYAIDSCMNQFTIGQAQLMSVMWTQYRAS
ncbi:MAG: zinc metalloprotease [Marmoricola sp.]